MPSKSPLDSLTPAQRILVAVAVLVVGGLFVAVRGCKDQPPSRPPAGEPGQTLANRNVRYGMPAEARADPASKNAYLIDRPQYVLSYNDAKKIPNWACWNLNSADIGKTPRGDFAEDPDLPQGFRRIKHGDYTGFGFDRGHLCPAKDRSDTEENNRATFYMTNMMPQAPNCNRGGWERFESHCRDLTRDGSELYIACGPHGIGGTGDKGPAQTVGKTVQIEVPAACWKVVLVVPKGEPAPGAKSRMLAIWMPNDQTVPEDWKPYAVSAAEVENRTGYKFFPLVPDDVLGPLKSRADGGP